MLHGAASAEGLEGAGVPFLTRITALPDRIAQGRYPFDIGAFLRGIDELYFEHLFGGGE